MTDTKTSFEQIEEVLEIAPAPVSRMLDVVTKSTEVIPRGQRTESSNPEELANEARDVYRRMMAKSEDLLDDLSEVARGSEHPRAYEVAATLIKTITDTAQMLEKSASTMIKKEEQNGGVSNVQNNLYIGSSEDLMKLIRNNSNS